MGIYEKRNKAITFNERSGCLINDEPNDDLNPIAGAIAGVEYYGESDNDNDIENIPEGPGKPPDEMEPDDEPE